MQLTRKLSLSRPDIVFVIALIAAIAFSAVAILMDSGRVPLHPMDQAFVQAADISISRARGHWEFHYPFLQYSGGITSTLIVGLYKLIVPTSLENLNWHIRIMAMSAYILSTAALIVSFTKSHGARVLAVLLVASSGFQFIQPSSELLAGSLLTLYLVGVRRHWAVPVSALMLVGFGLGKVEFGLAAIVISIFWWTAERKLANGAGRFSIPLWTFFWFAVFLLPGLAVNGIDAVAGNRSFLAFGQHYGSLFGPHQFKTFYLDPWNEGPGIVKIIYPAAKSVADLALKYPRQYLDFLAMSMVESVLNIMTSLRFLLIPVLVVACQPRSWKELRFPLIALALAIFFTLLPAWLFAFVRIRYMAKLYPAIICLALAGSLSITPSQDRRRWLIWLPALLTLLLQMFGIKSMWMHSHYM
ncbi:MAG: hypothetical protein ACK46L_10140 [Synechococcaceae cyanobacterium]